MQRLSHALSSLSSDESGHYYQGSFIFLLQDSRSAKFYPHLKGGTNTATQLSRLETNYLLLYMDLVSLVTICFRLKWQQNLWAQNQMTDDLWRLFVSLDIDVFFSKYRSIFDHVARIISMISPKPGQSPMSFNNLKNTWVAKPNNQSMLGSDLSKFVRSCDWFDLPASIRDLITHNGAETVPSYEDKRRILFRVYHKDEMKVYSPEFGIVGGRFMDFEIFAGLYVGYLIAYLEELSTIIYRKLASHDIDLDAKDYHPGYKILKEWISSVTSLAP